MRSSSAASYLYKRQTVRGAAMTIGRLKRTFNSTKEEFEKQIGADDIRLELHNEQIMDNLKKWKMISLLSPSDAAEDLLV